MCVAFNVIVVYFNFQIFFFETELCIECFLYDVAHVIPNALKFSNGKVILVLKDMHQFL